MAGFSFNLKTDYAPSPLAAPMIEQVLLWNEIEPQPVASAISDQLLQMIRSGSTARDFVKWCRCAEGPQSIAGLDERWASLLFSSVALATCSHHAYLESIGLSAFMPYWMLSSVTDLCSPHSVLDGFVARIDDPIWKDIYPPNGWLCGCSALSVGTSDAEREQGLNREIPASVRAECSGWMTKRPDRIRSVSP
jgi:hypothetical protein